MPSSRTCAAATTRSPPTSLPATGPGAPFTASHPPSDPQSMWIIPRRCLGMAQRNSARTTASTRSATTWPASRSIPSSPVTRPARRQPPPSAKPGRTSRPAKRDLAVVLLADPGGHARRQEREADPRRRAEDHRRPPQARRSEEGPRRHPCEGLGSFFYQLPHLAGIVYDSADVNDRVPLGPPPCPAASP